MLYAQNTNVKHVKYLEGQYSINVTSGMDAMTDTIAQGVKLFTKLPVNVHMQEEFHSAQYITNITKYGLHAKDKFEIFY